MAYNGSDGNTTIRRFILNLTKKINNCKCEEELKIMIKLRKIYFKINKDKIEFNPLEKQIKLLSGDLFWEFCGQNNFMIFFGKKNIKYNKYNKITYNYNSLAGELFSYYF